jgi:hypothetical protein
MKSAYIYLTFVIAFSLISVTAQTNSVCSESRNKISTDNIFNDIMQSLPADVKLKLDSVSTVNNNANIVSRKNGPNTNKTYKGQLDGLSDDMRIRVEKAMHEIDLQKQKRQLQFKETKRKN